MIILDTNVVSALMRSDPVREVEAWLNKQSDASLSMNSISLLELRFGLLRMSAGKRRDVSFIALAKVLDRLDNRVAPFDSAAAEAAAELMATREKRGQPGNLRDTMIAGIAIANHAGIATRNTRHFSDLPIQVLNPWD